MNIRTTLPLILLSCFMAPTHLMADGFGIFASVWEFDDEETVVGYGLRGRAGTDLVYFELRGTYYEDSSSDSFDFSETLQPVPIDLGFGVHTHPDHTLQAYAGLGITYYFIDVENENVGNEVGYYVQIGGEVEIREGLGFYVEGVWRTVEAFADRDGDVNESAFDLEGGAINIGIVLRK